MVPIPTYAPAIQVTLLKLVQRKDGVAARYAAADRTIDLTPYLGDGGAVRVRKALAEPMGGFSISFGDRMAVAVGDTLAAFIEPMDMIEIRAARVPTGGGKLPLLMRGFVSSVRRIESLDQDGRPSRTVVVQGQDAGKLWKIHATWLELALLKEQPMLSTFQLQAATGIDTSLMSIGTFMTQLVQRVMNVKIAELSAFANRQIAPFATNISVAQGQITPSAAGAIDAGPYWNVVERFADRPWNEVFVEDTEDGPVFVFRPTPYKDVQGNLIMPGAADPGTIELDASLVQSLDMSRSDERLANFFWVPPGASGLDTNGGVNVATLLKDGLFDEQHGNNAPALYGEKRMEVATTLQPDALGAMPTKLPDDQQNAAVSHYLLWHEARAITLKLMNRDNGVFEFGGASVAGSETLRPGRYLRLTRGSLVSESYIVAVNHTILPLNTWTTDLTLERGTNFLVCNSAEGSPYVAEQQQRVGQ